MKGSREALEGGKQMAKSATASASDIKMRRKKEGQFSLVMKR